MAEGKDVDRPEPAANIAADEVGAENEARAEAVPGSHNLPVQLTSFIGR